MKRPVENNLRQHVNVSAALKAPMTSRKNRQLPAIVALCCGLIILVVLIGSPLLAVSSAFSNNGTPPRTVAATPGTVRAQARAIFSTTTTETFTLTAQVFTGSTDCTSGGAAATTINNQGQSPYDVVLGPADSVLFTAAPRSDQTNELVIADLSGRFIDWLIPTGQAPGGLTVPPSTDGTQICVQGIDSPNVREVDATYGPAIQLRDPTCTTQLTAFHPGDTVCLVVFGGLVDTPAPQHLFGAGGTSSSNTECTFLPIPPAFTPVDVIGDPSTTLFTFPASNAAIPPACATFGNTTDIRGPWRVGVRTPDNNGVSAIKTFELTDPVSCSLSCGGDISVSNDPNQCGAVVNYTTPSGTGCGTVTCDRPSGSTFPVGTTLVTCTSSAGPTCSFNVTVNDTQNPTITLNSNVITLWSPNHTFETVQVSDLVSGAGDNCDAGVNLSSVYISKVTSDEVENGVGDGDTLNDMVIAADCKSVQLRAERQGENNGRVYTITFKVLDAAGNTATATARVRVPQSQNGAAAVDDGPLYTVLSACP